MRASPSSTSRRDAGEALASEIAGGGEAALFLELRRDRHRSAAGGDQGDARNARPDLRRSSTTPPMTSATPWTTSAAEYWDHTQNVNLAPSLLRRSGRPSANAGARIRLDHQSLVDRLAGRRRRDARLFRGEGRGRRAHASARPRLRPRQHPRQRHRARRRHDRAATQALVQDARNRSTRSCSANSSRRRCSARTLRGWRFSWPPTTAAWSPNSR